LSKLIPAKLTLEDFPEQRSWIGPLFSILNSFTGDLVRAFSNQLTVGDNLFQEIKEVKFVNQSGDFPLKFKTKFIANPQGLTPIYLFDNTVNAYSPLTPQVVWSYADGTISISNISGLTANTTYTIRLLLIYG
jgi:hypothetical protein